MRRKLNALIVVVALLLSAHLLVGAAVAQDAAGQTQGEITCDSDLMMNLYVAERFFDYDAFRNRLMERGVQVVDPAQFNFGQFEPLFQEEEAVQASTDIFTEEDFNTIADTFALDDAAFEQTLRDRFGGEAGAVLSPAAVAGEAPECAQLRANLNRFFSALAIHDFTTGFTLGTGIAAEPGVEATPAQPGVEATPAETGAEAPPAVTAPDATLDDVLDNPDAFYGQVVSVEGLLREFINERAFFFNDEDLIAPDELVVFHTGEGTFDAGLEEGIHVRVTGEVRQFILADFESEFGLDLDDNAFVEFENRPVIIASEVVSVEGQPQGG